MEIFIDALIKYEKIQQALFDINKLQVQVEDINQKCGSCYYWMTSNCYREKTHKVSANERKCDDFKIGVGYENIIKGNENKISELKSFLKEKNE